MKTCPSCGDENSDRARFCQACAAPLDEAPAMAREERKVVTVLFCDLVGFTAASDLADPEDVKARLGPYHARLRDEIERLGGTVEKFIGDAIMAVFGAPVAHEDDAERAVRSALRIIEAMDELNQATPKLGLQVRIGINTGEAVVALGAHPERGEGIVAGDVVNTAARLQQAAPAGAAVVGEVTYRSTRDAIEYQELPPVEVKGKRDPLSVWRATVPTRLPMEGDVGPATPFVGRLDDLAVLRQTYAHTTEAPNDSHGNPVRSASALARASMRRRMKPLPGPTILQYRANRRRADSSVVATLVSVSARQASGPRGSTRKFTAALAYPGSVNGTNSHGATRRMPPPGVQNRRSVRG